MRRRRSLEVLRVPSVRRGAGLEEWRSGREPAAAVVVEVAEPQSPLPPVAVPRRRRRAVREQGAPAPAPGRVRAVAAAVVARARKGSRVSHAGRAGGADVGEGLVVSVRAGAVQQLDLPAPAAVGPLLGSPVRALELGVVGLPPPPVDGHG